jgi:hypothetical protein
VQIESNVLNTILPILETTQLLGFVTRFNLVARRARVREVVLPELQMKRRLGVSVPQERLPDAGGGAHRGDPARLAGL